MGTEGKSREWRGVYKGHGVAKSEDMNKGSLCKCIAHGNKCLCEVMTYCTSSNVWDSFNWQHVEIYSLTISLETPRIHISLQYNCNFTGNMEIEKNVLT